MQIDPTHKLWLAAADSRETRPVLEHVNIERLESSDPLLAVLHTWTFGGQPANGLAVGADGFALAAVPILLADDDVVGLLSTKVLKEAARRPKTTLAGEKVTELALGQDDVRLSDGTIMPRWHAVGALRQESEGKRGLFPSWRRTLPARIPMAERAQGTLGFNPKLLAKVVAAIGADGRVAFTCGPSASSPILVESAPPGAGGVPSAPFAILMPMHLTSEYEHGNGFDVRPQSPLLQRFVDPDAAERSWTLVPDFAVRPPELRPAVFVCG